MREIQHLLDQIEASESDPLSLDCSRFLWGIGESLRTLGANYASLNALLDDGLDIKITAVASDTVDDRKLARDLCVEAIQQAKRTLLKAQDAHSISARNPHRQGPMT